MYILSFTVPKTHIDIVKDAIFCTGAGRVDNYQHCAWQVLGEGCFMPLSGSSPYIGEPGKLERVAEYKVEIVCTKDQVKEAVAALKNSHPYECPSYQVIPFEVF